MNFKTKKLSEELRLFISSMKGSWRITLLTALFICGLIIGSFVIKNNNGVFSEQLNAIIEAAIANRINSDIFKSFIEVFLVNTVFLIITFSLGLCAVGIPAICFIPVIKGFSTGITGAYIYLNYSIKGVCYCLFVLFPAQILMSAILIIACNEGFYMSADIFDTLNKGSVKEKNLAGLYLTRFALLLLLSFFTSILDVFLSRLFSSVFVLF